MKWFRITRTWFGVVALAIALSLTGAAREQSAVFQACVSKQTTSYSAKPIEKGAANVGVSFLQSWPIAFNCTGVFLDENNSAITAVATLIIAAFTIVLTAVTDRQARLTKEALIADKRAFVHSTGISQYWTLNKETNEHDWHFRIQWQNSGDTPTRNMMMFSECEVRTAPLPSGFDFDRPTVNPATAFIGPKTILNGGLTPTPGRAPISPQDILDAQAGRKLIYIWGWAKYSDVFPKTQRHVTRVCWVIVPVGDPKMFIPGTTPPQEGSLAFTTIHHHEGNCADDECA